MNQFSELDIPQDLEYEVRDSILMLKKWNWNYEDCLKFQKKAQAFIQVNRKLKIYIFCNHPHCFTMGRGNERGVEGLVDLTESEKKSVKFPVYNIHRGGGITFHYPGQWIFYPIVALKESYNLCHLTNWMLKSVKTVLTEDFEIPNVITANKLMGVWKDKSKLASIGIGISKFVTEHGLALNLLEDKEMFFELRKINPCGINPTTYITAESQMNEIPNEFIESFHHAFVQKFL